MPDSFGEKKLIVVSAKARQFWRKLVDSYQQTPGSLGGKVNSCQQMPGSLGKKVDSYQQMPGSLGEKVDSYQLTQSPNRLFLYLFFFLIL